MLSIEYTFVDQLKQGTYCAFQPLSLSGFKPGCNWGNREFALPKANSCLGSPELLLHLRDTVNDGLLCRT